MRSSGTRHALFWVAVVAALLPVASSAQRAQTVVLATGVKGRTYHDVYGVNMKALLPAFRVTFRESEGSLENLDLLADGRADVGFAQVDVFAARVRANEKRYGDIGIVGPLADECVFVAYRKNGEVQSFAGLKEQLKSGRPPKIGVGERSSGMHGTWQFVRQVSPDYAVTEVDFTAGTLAINHLAAGLLDAVAWVTNPSNRQHKLIRALRANDELRVGGLDDPELVHNLPNGTVIYEIDELVGVGDKNTFSTVCTRTAILVRPGANPRLVDAVSDLLSLDKKALLKTR